MLTLGIPPGEGLFQTQRRPSKSGPLSASLNLRSPSLLHVWMIMHLFWAIEPPHLLNMNWLLIWTQSINNICLHTHTHPSQILSRHRLADLHSSCDNNWCHLLCRNFHKHLPKAKLNEIELISFFKVLWMSPDHVSPSTAMGVWYVTAPVSAGTCRGRYETAEKS